jgi:hypothetical protein
VDENFGLQVEGLDDVTYLVVAGAARTDYASARTNDVLKHVKDWSRKHVVLDAFARIHLSMMNGT